jgi:hypothetical protein
MFDKFVLDITNLEVGEHLKVADLASQLPENAKFLDDENRVVCVVEVPRIVEEEVEEGALEDEAVISEAAEPEIIGKGKGEGAEEGEGTE